jgi:hypothetical protein
VNVKIKGDKMTNKEDLQKELLAENYDLCALVSKLCDNNPERMEKIISFVVDMMTEKEVSKILKSIEEINAYNKAVLGRYQ